jgi:uncharacterized protein YjbJ (UPF0337 family)
VSVFFLQWEKFTPVATIPIINNRAWIIKSPSPERRKMMNRDILEGKWYQLRGRIRETWGDLTDDEIDQINGKIDILRGKLQEKYGYTYDEAEEEINTFLEDIEVERESEWQ